LHTVGVSIDCRKSKWLWVGAVIRFPLDPGELQRH
jgi:hypothetical protein